jgi:hypothetical protein
MTPVKIDRDFTLLYDLKPEAFDIVRLTQGYIGGTCRICRRFRWWPIGVTRG